MFKNIIISCFDLSGVMVEEWAKAGYECHIVDTQHEKGEHTIGNITKWGMDVFEWEKVFLEKYPDKIKNVLFASFFPPCTDLAVSGARWFKNKEEKNPGTRERAMNLVYWSDKIGKLFDCPYFIENPVSVISSIWRKPNHSFHPYEYGGYEGGSDDGYTKKTCLWTNEKFILPPKKPIELDPLTHDRIHKKGPSADRQNFRSKTPKGFARAIFEQYKN